MFYWGCKPVYGYDQDDGFYVMQIFSTHGASLCLWQIDGEKLGRSLQFVKSKINSGSMKGKVFISALSAYTLALDNSERNAETIASLLQDIIGKLQTLGMIAFHGHLVASAVVKQVAASLFPRTMGATVANETMPCVFS